MTQIMKMTKIAAAKISRYQTLDITELANGYCAAKDANDQFKMDSYIAALILRFWYVQGKMAKQCKAVTLLEFDDYYERLFYCIDTACNYRAWQDPEKHLNAQQCIQAAIGSRGAAELLYSSNLAKEKANINKAQLDRTVDTDEDNKAVTQLDILADASVDVANPNGEKAVSFIQGFINKNKVVEAIILDNIAFGDSIKTTTETSTEYYCVGVDDQGIEQYEELKIKTPYVELWTYKIVQGINRLTEDYAKYFLAKYKVQPEVFTAAFDSIKHTTNTKLHKALNKVLTEAKENVTWLF